MIPEFPKLGPGALAPDTAADLARALVLHRVFRASISAGLLTTIMMRAGDLVAAIAADPRAPIPEWMPEYFAKLSAAYRQEYLVRVTARSQGGRARDQALFGCTHRLRIAAVADLVAARAPMGRLLTEIADLCPKDEDPEFWPWLGMVATWSTRLVPGAGIDPERAAAALPLFHELVGPCRDPDRWLLHADWLEERGESDLAGELRSARGRR